MQQAELFISEQQFDTFMKHLPRLDLAVHAPLEEQAFPRHFDLVYKERCLMHFDYTGSSLDLSVRGIIEDGKIRLRPEGDFSLLLQELKRKIAFVVKIN